MMSKDRVRGLGPHEWGGGIPKFEQVQVLITWGPSFPMDSQNDMTEDIIFPQLCRQAVKIRSPRLLKQEMQYIFLGIWNSNCKHVGHS